MKVAVIGGGIQGCCLALELAHRGVTVDLIEKRSRLMDGASRHSEGKIHLGFVYANDPTMQTPLLMLQGAMSFAPHLRHWLGPAFDSIPVSSPFDYVVHRESLLSPDRLYRIYHEISARIDTWEDRDAYFGVEHPHRIVRRDKREISGRYGPDASAVFSTEEVAVDPDHLADLMSKTVKDASPVSVRLNTTVRSIDGANRSLIADDLEAETISLGPYDHIANCSWEGRPAIDATVGIHPPSPWSYRMRYFARASGRADRDPIRSVTIVLGPFGDLVDYGTGEYYLSWYPAGRRGWSSLIQPPDWPVRPVPSEAASIERETLRGLSGILPDLEERVAPDLSDVRGGVIYALGDTDVDDPQSSLHQRSEVGPIAWEGWYHSVDTGKYTTAPLFAMKTADLITQP